MLGTSACEKSVGLGNNLVESWSYIPSRQQPWKIQLGAAAQPSSVEEFVYDYCPSTAFLGASCASNNGNVMGQKRGSLGAGTALRSGGTPVLARSGADFTGIARASESDQDALDLVE